MNKSLTNLDVLQRAAKNLQESDLPIEAVMASEDIQMVVHNFKNGQGLNDIVRCEDDS